MPRSAATKTLSPSEAHKLAYVATTPPAVGDPLPVTLGELHDLADHAGILMDYTITDDGGLNISWTAGMVRTPTGEIVLTIAGSGTCTDDAINYLNWISGSSLTLSTTMHVHDTQLGIGHIACQNGDIWETHTDPPTRDVVPDIQMGLEAIFPLAVASGCLVSEDVDATDPLDVTVSAGSYYHDLHDLHEITAFDTRTADTLIRCNIDGAGPETWNFTADGANSEIDVGNCNSGTNLIGTAVGKYYKGLFIVSEDNVFWVYAQGEHNTVAQAIDGALPSIPEGLTLFPRSVAYVYKHGDTAFEASTSDRWIDVRPVVTGSVAAGPITDHGNLVGLADNDHAGYLWLLGRAGGQVAIGGTGAGEDLTLQSTSHATKGSIILGIAGTSAYDEVNDRLGLGQAAPASTLHIEEAGTAKANTDFMQLVNNANAADMDGTRTSILWRQARVTDTLLDAGRVGFEAADDWTATAGTQDADFVVECLEQGSMVEKLRITPDANGGLLDIFGRIVSRRGDGVSNPCIILSYADTAGLSPTVSCRRARGTFALPTAVQIDTVVGGFECRGHDGTSHQNRASVVGVCDGTPNDGTNSVPTALHFRTGLTTSTLVRLRIDSSGDVRVSTAAAHLEFVRANEYITGSTGLLKYETGTGVGHRFSVNETVVAEIDGSEMRLMSGITERGSLGWTATAVSLYNGISERLQILAATQSFLGGLLVSASAHAAPATSAILELASTTGALLVSRMTTAQRNALTAVDGMILYNSSDGEFNFREGGAWVTGSGLA